MSKSMCAALVGRPLLVSAVIASAAAAQAPLALPSSSGTVSGTVRDTTGVPLALVRLTSSGLITLSDSVGSFTLGGLPIGRVTLAVRRLGFEPLDLSIELSGGRVELVNVVLTMLPQDLPGVTSQAHALADVRLADFYRHRQTGIGFFLDRKEIESRRAQRISDILRRLPGIRVLPDRGGRSGLRMGRASGGRDCPPDVWIDGVRAAFMNPDDKPLTDVEALEVYRGPAGVPPEMNTRLGSPACGAIIIWTRLPG
jgi:hypothetical protein